MNKDTNNDTIVKDTIVEDTIVEVAIVEVAIVEDTIVEDTIVEAIHKDIVEDTIVEDINKANLEDEELKELFTNSDILEVEKEIPDFDIDKEISEITIEMENDISEQNEKKIEEMADDIIKIKDRQAQKKMQVDLLVDIIKNIGFNVSNIKDISSLTFDRDFLKQKSIQDKIIVYIPELRKCYNSAYLTCLHSNADKKQKNLGINVLRQLMKCNYLNMKPKVVSHGYDKASGKKLVSRIYLIEKMLY